VIWMGSCGTAAKAGGKQRTQTPSWSHGSLLSIRKKEIPKGSRNRFLPSYDLIFLPSSSFSLPARVALQKRGGYDVDHM
jgi:hypothetical protein